MKENETYLNMLINTYISSDSNVDEITNSFNKILNFANEYYNGTVFRYRPYEEKNIDAFEKDLLFISNNNYYQDVLDSKVSIDASKIVEDITKDIERLKNDPYQLLDNNLLPVDIKEKLKEILDKDEEKQLYDKVIAMKSQFIDFVKKKAKDYIDYLNKQQYRSICFCENPISNVMWDRYGNGHKGFCLEYMIQLGHIKNICSSCMKKCKNKLEICLLPVAYSKYKFDATYMISKLIKNDLSNKLFGFTSYSEYDMFFQHKVQLIKCEDGYIDENEYRLIVNSKCPAINLKPVALYLGYKLSRHEKDRLALIAKNKGILVYEVYDDVFSTDYKMKKSIYQFLPPLNYT